MSNAVSIAAESVNGMHVYVSGGSISMSINMTIDQRKAAIVELLGTGWPEHEAYAFLRDEFSDWFSEVDA
jgi:hypothetical protein